MGKLSKEVAAIMTELFGQDTLVSLATWDGDRPTVRKVDGYYEDGAFYVITYGLSNKMRQIADNPVVGLCGDWFSAHGRGINMGYFGKPENADIAGKLRKAFAAWIDNGHNNFEDENTIILCVRLTDGVLFHHGVRYDIDFGK